MEESINAKLSSTYKAAGSIEAPNASYLVEANVGKVYNVSAAFTTDTNFVEGSGKKHPAGTNIVVVTGDSSDYKFDVLAGFVDLSDYAKTESLSDVVREDDLEPYAKTEDLPGEATTSEAGLMSATDKEKLDGITFATDQEVEAMLNRVFGSEAAE